MQSIIKSTDSFTNTDNLILPVDQVKEIPADLFSDEELSYIKTYHKEHKQNDFVFNRLDHWVFVIFIEKEKDPYTRLESYRSAGARLQPLLAQHKIVNVVIAGEKGKPSWFLALAEGLALRNYQFLKYKTKAPEQLSSLNEICLHAPGLLEEELDQLNILVDAVCRCRNLVNEPVATLNAPQLAVEIETLAKEAGCKVEVFNRKKIESLKMGGVLAVNRGSVDPPTFSIMEWKPENAVNKKPYVFVGKGVVFDTGGMNIKTANFMNDMKSDMAGGATVATALYAIARAKLPVHVVALVPATDNRVNGNAYVNGDVITMYDGTSVEIINTDAEGRMLLADALSYAKKYDPELVIDVATLTGSAMRAIGSYGIVGMHQKATGEFKKLRQSGELVYERLVEFPFWKEYEEELKSDIADIKHLGGVNGGAITAGKFLAHFTDYPYIHLDIAGPSFLDKTWKYYPVGGTAMGVRLLFDFIRRKV